MVTAGVGLVTPTTEARGLVLVALLYVPCAVVLAATGAGDGRRARATGDGRGRRATGAARRGAAWR